MNRIIKFRGKRIDNGEWCYGYYVRLEDYFRKPINGKERITHRIYSGSADTCTSENGYDFSASWYDVNPNTVSQFTGLTDKNKKEIYEGDILKVYYYGKSKVFGIVRFDKTRFYIDDEFMNNELKVKAPMTEIFARYQFEVIGNIHDNTELMKGGDNE